MKRVTVFPMVLLACSLGLALACDMDSDSKPMAPPADEMHDMNGMDDMDMDGEMEDMSGDMNGDGMDDMSGDGADDMAR